MDKEKDVVTISSGLESHLTVLMDSFEQVLEQVYPGLVIIQDGRRGSGAGIIWDRSGLVVTNNHVVGRSRRLLVQLADGGGVPPGWSPAARRPTWRCCGWSRASTSRPASATRSACRSGSWCWRSAIRGATPDT